VPVCDYGATDIVKTALKLDECRDLYDLTAEKNADQLIQGTGGS